MTTCRHRNFHPNIVGEISAVLLHFNPCRGNKTYKKYNSKSNWPQIDDYKRVTIIEQ